MIDHILWVLLGIVAVLAISGWSFFAGHIHGVNSFTCHHPEEEVTDE